MESITWIEQCREIHLDWARVQERRRREGRRPVPYVGSATHHRNWVRRYDKVLVELKKVNS
jgi:hypothetical protein